MLKFLLVVSVAFPQHLVPSESARFHAKRGMESGRINTMRTFLVACLAAIVIAVGAALVLGTYVPDTSSRAFSTQSVRI